MAEEVEQFIELDEVNIKSLDTQVDDSYQHSLDGNDYVSFTTFVDNDSFNGNFTNDYMRQLAEAYGNNIFELEVEPGNSIIGVLKDVPSLSMNCTWEKTGISTLQDKLLDLQKDKTYQMINALLGAKQVPMITGGSATSRTYKDCSRPDFNLQFRIYSKQAIGPGNPNVKLTGYKRALAMLSIYSPALHTMDASNTLTIGAANLGSTLVAGLSALNDMVEFTTDKLSEGSDHDPETQTRTGAAVSAVFGAGGLLLTDMQNLVTGSDTAGASRQLQSDLAATMDRLGKSLDGNASVMHYDSSRVSDANNWYKGLYGGALWNLTILPGVLSHKLPVYVQNWTVKPSKEIDSSGEAAYYDFTVKCVLDQTKSANWWLKLITDNDFSQYKLNFKNQAAARM